MFCSEIAICSIETKVIFSYKYKSKFMSWHFSIILSDGEKCKLNIFSRIFHWPHFVKTFPKNISCKINHEKFKQSDFMTMMTWHKFPFKSSGYPANMVLVEIWFNSVEMLPLKDMKVETMKLNMIAWLPWLHGFHDCMASKLGESVLFVLL